MDIWNMIQPQEEILVVYSQYLFLWLNHIPYDSTTRRDTGGLFPDRSDFRGTDPYDPRANRDRY